MSQHIDPTPKQTDFDALNSNIIPDEWQSVNSEYGTIYYRSNGFMCELYYNNDNHTRTETSSLQIATLPVGARPSRNFNLLPIKGSNGIYIYSNGGFYITNLNDAYVGFHTMYFVGQ